MAVQVVDDGSRRARPEAAIEHRRLTLGDELVPGAELELGIGLRSAERLRHEAVVVGRDVDRQLEVGEDAVRLAGLVEVGRAESANLVAEQRLRKESVAIDAEELGHTGEIPAVPQRVSELPRPVVGES